MTGIGGVKMWMEDYLMNSSSYPEDYRKNFIKIKRLWNSCLSEFSECKSIKACNDCYEKYEEEVDNLRGEFYKYYGRGKMPIGLSDTLDYFEEAVGDLEDRALEKLTNGRYNFKTTIPFEYPYKYIDQVAGEYQNKYPDIDFRIYGNKITLTGQYWDVSSFFEEEFHTDYRNKAMEEGEFINV